MVKFVTKYKDEEEPPDPKNIELGKILPISGKVDNVTRTPDKKGNKIIVYTPNSKLYITTYCYHFCPVQKGDAIVGAIKHKGNGVYEFVSSPMVEIATDKNSIILVISKALKCSESKSLQLYNKVASLCPDEDTSTIINYFNDLSVKYTKGELDIEYPNDNTISPKYVNQGQFLSLLSFWHQQRVVRQLYLLGLNNGEIKLACYLHDISIEQLYTRCRDNPNSICNLSAETVFNIVAKTCRFPTKEQNECGVIIRHLYYNLNRRKWNCTSANSMIRVNENWRSYLETLQEQYDVIFDSDRLYIKKIYIIESTVAEDFKTLIKNDPLIQYYYMNNEFPAVGSKGEIVIDNKFYKYDREAFLLEDKRMIHEQVVAIQAAIDHKICIITGSAGSGKSSLMFSIIKCLLHRDLPFYLCSFTGKAVARIKQVVENVPAYTIHRLISEIKDMGKNATAPAYIIVDEASMVSLPLFYELMRTIKEGFGPDSLPRMIFIGDNNQLPPIEWGSMFQGMIDSKVIPIYALLHNHRVDEDPQDGIVINASAMINNLGTDNVFNFAFSHNFVINDSNIDTLYNYIEVMYEEGVEKENFRVLSPYRKDLDKINRKIQLIYNVDKKFVKDSRDKYWYIGDIVIMCHNNYDIDVMNGEEGVVTRIEETFISVKFGDEKVADFALEPPHRGTLSAKKFTYVSVMSNDEVNDDMEDNKILSVKHLRHAYASTVHSAQGSEWHRIIMWIPYDMDNKASTHFFNCNLSYTTITRARKSFLALGNTDLLLDSTKFGLPYRNEKFTYRLKHNMRQIEMISFRDQDLDIRKLPKMYISASEAYGIDEEDDEPF